MKKKKEMIAVLWLVQAVLNFPAFSGILLSKEGILGKGVLLFAFLYMHLIFSNLEVKLLFFLGISKTGKVEQKRKKLWSMWGCLAVLCFFYLGFLFTGSLEMLAAVVSFGVIVFTDLSSTVIVRDGIPYYYNEKTLELEITGQKENCPGGKENEA